MPLIDFNECIGLLWISIPNCFKFSGNNYVHREAKFVGLVSKKINCKLRILQVCKFEVNYV